MKITRFLIFALSLGIVGSILSSMRATGAPAQKYRPCNEDTVRRKQRSSELQTLVAADQADRQAVDINWDVVAARDEARARRVGEIFGEGCLQTAQDYSAAALIIQHGPGVDHGFQAYLWAKRALELGDSTRRDLMSEGIDRFLIRQGYKQLFGKITHRNGPLKCRCLDDVEESFPENKRVEMGGKSLVAALKEIAEYNSSIAGCSSIKFCGGLKTPPIGIVPGIW